MTNFDVAALEFLAISSFNTDGSLADIKILSREGGSWHIADPSVDQLDPDDSIFFMSEEIDSLAGSGDGDKGAFVDIQIDAVEVELPPGVGPLTDTNAIFIANFLENTVSPGATRRAVRVQTLEGAKKQRVPGADRAVVRDDDPTRAGDGQPSAGDGGGAGGSAGADLGTAQEEAAGALQGRSGEQPSGIVRALPWIGSAALVSALGWAVFGGKK
jgi:hypothetical protein